MNVRLSSHFTLDEMCATSYPEYQDDEVSTYIVENLRKLSVQVLEPLRTHLGSKPLKISSGYRSMKLNEVVGGVFNSAHLDGRAADIPCVSVSRQEKIYAFLKSLSVCKSVIKERKGFSIWVHVNI